MYGLIGEKLGHSYSKYIHEQLADYTYDLMPVAREDLDAFLTKRDFAAVNVTIPYKQAVMPYCAELSADAAAIGSVNCLVKRADGTLYGDNTDLYGFEMLAKSAGISLSGKVVILGSGGTSLTVRAAVKRAGGSFVVISRSGEDNYENIARHADADVVVNTTPVGMYPNMDENPVDLSVFTRLSGVLDVVYNPFNTDFILQAKRLGIPAASGLLMLVAQAKRACEVFLGKDIPDDVIPRITDDLRIKLGSIVFVGMPGCGKSTVGALVAEKLSLPLFDTDQWVEEHTGRRIPDIFAEEGEAVFRALEKQAVETLSAQKGCVIATGGGAVKDEENVRALRRSGRIVYLRRDLHALATGGRPLSAGGMDALEKLYEERRGLYEAAADLTVDNDGSPDDAAAAILEVLL